MQIPFCGYFADGITPHLTRCSTGYSRGRLYHTADRKFDFGTSPTNRQDAKKSANNKESYSLFEDNPYSKELRTNGQSCQVRKTSRDLSDAPDIATPNNLNVKHDWHVTEPKKRSDGYLTRS